MRSPFQRDRDRIVHSTAFRRLEYKTQVFVSHEDDHFRTRLTHTLEVAQIARTAARALGLDEDLAEAVALAHDLGHSPFGHAGEDALDAVLEAHGGFDHNAQTLRVITFLERRYAEFDGLNLTWETLEGVVKHNGPLTRRCRPTSRATAPGTIWNWPRTRAPRPRSRRSPTTSPTPTTISTTACARRCSSSPISPICRWSGRPSGAWPSAIPGIEAPRLIHESLRRLINLMVVDLVEETARRLAALPSRRTSPRSVAATQPVVGFSPEVGEALQRLRGFLYSRMYSHYKVKRMQRKARQVVRELFAGLLERPGLPAAGLAGARRRARAMPGPPRRSPTTSPA